HTLPRHDKYCGCAVATGRDAIARAPTRRRNGKMLTGVRSGTQMPRSDVIDRDHLAARHDDRAFHRVLQLANVARPAVVQDPRPRVGFESRYLLAVLLCIT